MQSCDRLIRRAFRAGLMAGVLWLAASGDAPAQQSCSSEAGVYTCTVAAGKYASEIDIAIPVQGNNLPATEVTSQGNVSLSLNGQSNPTALNILGYAGDGNSGSIDGGESSGMSVTNSGSLTLTAAQT